MKNKKANKIERMGLIVLVLIIIPYFVYADSWTSDKPSHSTLYVDTLTSKTDSSAVNIADSQGLFSTGDITTLGNVGVGTTNPAAKLEIGASIGGANNYLRLTNTASGRSLNIFNTGGSWSFRTTSDGDPYTFDKQDGTSLLFINPSTGYIGIGTTAPAERLHIQSDAISGAHAAVRLGVTDSNSGDPKIAFVLGTGGSFDWGMGVDNSDGDKFKIGSYPNLENNNIMTITGAGNVGIGTTNPESNLEIRSTFLGIANLIKLTNAVEAYPALLFEGRRGGVSHQGQIFLDSDNQLGTEGLIFRVLDSSGNFVRPLQMSSTGIRLGAGTLDKNSVYIGNDGGNVGIGTTNPNRRLTIGDTADNAYIGFTVNSGTSERIIIGRDSAANGFIITDANLNKVFTVRDDTGNVGIGTTNPGAKLQVTHTTANDDDVGLQVETLTGAERARINLVHPSRSFQFSTNGAALEISDQTAGATRVAIDNSGNLGIGSTNPGAKQTILGGDVYVASQGNGIILKDNADGTCRRVILSGGSLSVSGVIACPSS